MTKPKLFLLLGFVALILVLTFLTPLGHFLSREGFSHLQDWIAARGVWAPAVFGLIYMGATLFALPGSVLTIVGGLLFGPLWGTLINWASASLGAMGSFFIARYLGRDVTQRVLRKQPLLEGLDQKIGKHGFYSVLFLRLVPLFPFNGLNFGLGLTQVSFKDYAWGTVLGILPGSFVYTTLGAAGRHISLRDPSTWKDVRVWGPFVLVILLSLLPKLTKIIRKTKGPTP